ncbi:hypothetical protein GF327_10510 [Candidatus Woesearchaeota archaeon]|nr:hypothetical protein [Candidatus Woesearchaeota archaeon]
MKHGVISIKGKSVTKKKEEKLLKIDLNFKNNKITDIKIKGDFFAYPEEAIEKLEKELIDCKLDSDSLTDKIKYFMKKNKVKLFGLSVESIAEGIMKARSSGQQ